MTSKFTEILDTSTQPAYTHPHLNVSLEDVLAEEGRKRSSSDSAAGYSAASSSPSSSPRSGSRSPEWGSQAQEQKDSLKRRLTFGRRRTKE